MSDIEDAVITFVETIDDVNNYRTWLGERRQFLAFDSETGGLEFWKQPLRLVQIGDTQQAWVFRADRWLGVVEETFQRYTGPLVGHNAPFDIRFLNQYGINVLWGQVHDTKIMAHILDPTKSTSLKPLGRQFLSPRARKLQGALEGAMAKQKWGWGDIPLRFPIYWGYGGLDAILTARLAENFYPQVNNEYADVYNLELQVQRICSNMEVKGTRINVEYCERMYEKTTEYCAALEKYCLENWRVRPSETQKVAIKLTELGVDLSKTTATGQWAMDKDVLEGIEHPLAQAVLEHRKKTKIASTYFGNFLDMHDNGIIHPSINTLGARTGRMSMSKPALQTLPRGHVVRDGFIPRSDNIWLSVDFDNIEMRLLAHFCQDPGMLEAARTSDMHLEMAKIAYGDPEMRKSDLRRQTFKNANFAKAYVAGVERFAETAGLTFELAKGFLDFYDERFPGVKEFQKKVERVAKRRLETEGMAYVKTPLGRRHPAEKDKLYTLVNHLNQGTAADVYKQSLIDLDNSGFGEFLLLPAHDETNMEIPVVKAEILVPEIIKSMTQENWSVPLTVSYGMGTSWGAAK